MFAIQRVSSQIEPVSSDPVPSSMTEEPPLKPVVWVGSSRKDLRNFPDPVQNQVGYAIYIAQRGGKHRDTKVLTGF
jgi:phage-related protein